MWFKWLAALVIIIVIGIIVNNRDDTLQQIQTEPVLRSARQIIMHERKADSDVSTIIQAKSVVEQSEDIFFLDNFELSQSDGLHITGIQAVYNMKDSVLTVKGPVIIDTDQGRKARLDGLVWDRQSQKATTENPVVVEALEGIIKANKAEFLNDFNQIRFFGGVHAQISQNILYN